MMLHCIGILHMYFLCSWVLFLQDDVKALRTLICAHAFVDSQLGVNFISEVNVHLVQFP